VLGDGLAPEAKTRKLFEVDRHERRVRRTRRLISLLLPGSAQLLRGRALLGTALLVAWLAALIAWKPDLLAGLERALQIELALEELRRVGLAAGSEVHPLAVLGLLAALLVWFGANAWRFKRREA